MMTKHIARTRAWTGSSQIRIHHGGLQILYHFLPPNPPKYCELARKSQHQMEIELPTTMCHSPLVPPAASPVLLVSSAAQPARPPLPVEPVNLFIVLCTYNT